MIIVQNHTQLTRTHDITYSEENSRQTLLSIMCCNCDLNQVEKGGQYRRFILLLFTLHVV